MNIEEWMNKARESISGIESGKFFIVKDLFDGYEWNSLPKGDRLSFGRYFKNAVVNKKVDGVHYAGKLDNNSAYYGKD